ncbi:MAG: hypothetical protein K1X94_11885 [Sandaracinaceae bacterium]|nr:hypothetical protein [Sandaracinaceae bacterium]
MTSQRSLAHSWLAPLTLGVSLAWLAASCACETREELVRRDVGLDAPGLDAPFVAEDTPFSIDAAIPSDASNMYAIESGPGCEVGGRACTPIDPSCGAVELCGDGLDNDCNRLVDEHCGCMPGTVQSCFAGPPGSRGVGACSDGTQRCEGAGEFGEWGACTGGISPSAETCDLLDNDCNGCADEHDCCGGELSCPGPGDPRIPSARPFDEVVLDGTSFFPGAAASWSWEVEGGPCESVIPVPTFSTSGATSSSFRFTPTLSGDYTVTMHVRTTDGRDLSCTFLVHVAGEGLRVELCWLPTTGVGASSDLDLYLHEPDTTTPWFGASGNVVSPGVTLGNSCNWANCAPGLRSSLPRASWGLATSPLDRCDRGPAGPGWTGIGNCPNPRIDVDGHGSSFEPLHGFLENINVDDPRDGQSFRVMVHDCSGPSSHPVLNVYCGGFLRATLGAAPDTITLPGGGSCASDTDTVWRAADVLVHVDGSGVTTDCDVTPITATGGGPRFTRGDFAY